MTPTPILRDAEGRGCVGLAPRPALKLMPEWRLFCGAHKRRAQRHTDSENVWNPDTVDAFATKGRRAVIENTERLRHRIDAISLPAA